MFDLQQTSDEIATGRPEIAILAVGAIEQHGPALPVITDFHTISEVSRRLAPRIGAFVLPAIPYSMSECHGPTAGTVWLQPETLAEVVRDLTFSLYDQGFRKVVLLNGHGGNFVLEPLVQELNAARPDLMVIMPGYAPSRPGVAPIFQSAHLEVHAGESETSTVLYLNGANVTEERIDCVPPVGREFLDYAYVSYLSPHGIWGNATQATAEKGERAVTQRLSYLEESIPSMFAALARVRGLDGGDLTGGEGTV
jgi:creatinine amidohydrolase